MVFINQLGYFQGPTYFRFLAMSSTLDGSESRISTLLLLSDEAFQ